MPGLIQVDENGNLRDWTAFCCSNAMSAMVYLKDPANVQDYAKTYAVLQKMAAEGIYGFTTVYTKDETKAMGLDGDFSFVLETDGYTSFSTDWNRPAVRPFDRNDFRYGPATHGYLPEKGTQPTFMAVGPSFRENVWLDSAAMIDEAPTFAALLGVPLPCSRRKNPAGIATVRKNHGKRALFSACNRHTSLFRCRGPRHMLHRAGASEPLPDGICVGSQACVCADYRRSCA